jgi:hypothetical protein
LGAEGHRLDTCGHSGVTRGHCDILEEVFKFLGKRNTTIASRREEGVGGWEVTWLKGTLNQVVGLVVVLALLKSVVL